MSFEEFKEEVLSSISELKSMVLETNDSEGNTNQVASQALQATETNEEKIHKLQQELSKVNRRISELESVM